jgi:putative peptidoglycan lipid II flippase
MMRVIAVGQSKGGAGVLAAALASLALGLYPYSAFLLFARALYALDDSRTPAVVALVTAIAGAGSMFVIAALVHGNAVVAATGLGHTIAYTLGSLVLAVVIRRRLGHPIFPRALLPTALIAGAYALAAWIVHQEIEPSKRAQALVFVIVVGAVAAVGYLVIWRRTRTKMRELRAARVPDSTGEQVLENLEDPDLARED